MTQNTIMPNVPHSFVNGAILNVTSDRHYLALDVEIDEHAEKRLCAFFSKQRRNLGDRTYLRDLCIALCPELDPTMVQAVAVIESSPTHQHHGPRAPLAPPPPPDPYNTMPRPTPASRTGVCYNCGQFPSRCRCPTAPVPQC